MTKTERLMLSVSAALLVLDGSACTPKRDAGSASPTPSPPGYASSGHGHGGGYGYGAGAYGRTGRTAGNGQAPVVTSAGTSHEGFFHRLFGSFGRAFHSMG